MPPLGLLYLASYLEKHGVSIKVLDPLSQGNQNYVPESRYTGITCMSGQFKKAQEIAMQVKAKNFETITFLGGAHSARRAEGIFFIDDNFVQNKKRF